MKPRIGSLCSGYGGLTVATHNVLGGELAWYARLPAGHVTDVPGLPRAAQLKALGNGVVPAQGAAALRMLLASAGQ